MPNILFSFNVWVKNVNKLLNISGVNSVNSSTQNQQDNISSQINWVKLVFIRRSVQSIYTTISTYIFTFSNLLNKSFTYYPQSLLMRLIKEN